MKYRLLALALVSVLAACGGSKSSATATTPTTPAAPAAAAGGTGTLTGVENGDRACYVNVTTDAGEQSLEGDFELCAGGSKDATALVGQRVTWTTHKDTVLAADCEGDMDCGRSDEVDLVDSITAAP